jgi:Cu+-exporting ATPase
LQIGKDPICRVKVDEKKAAGTSAYSGATYYFCPTNCKAEFDKNPTNYVKRHQGRAQLLQCDATSQPNRLAIPRTERVTFGRSNYIPSSMAHRL